MLLNRSGLRELPAGIDTIHNYYERLVLEKLMAMYAVGDMPVDMIADIACVALNRLPPRYIRHDVDMAFYLSPHEYDEIEAKVQNAINAGITFVEQRGRRGEE
jgi:competence protein ComFB